MNELIDIRERYILNTSDCQSFLNAIDLLTEEIARIRATNPTDKIDQRLKLISIEAAEEVLASIDENFKKRCKAQIRRRLNINKTFDEKGFIHNIPDRTCETCKFFHKYEHEVNNGHCKRQGFEPTKASDYCTSYKQKEAAQ